MFTVLVAADLSGGISGKCNFEFEFPQKPTLPQLRAQVEPTLAAEAELRGPQLFELSRIQIFDERLQMWVDLVASVQLENYSQLYAFQVESALSRDLPGQIPPPQRPCQLSMSAPRTTSPIRHRSASPQIPLPRPPSPVRYRSASPAAYHSPVTSAGPPAAPPPPLVAGDYDKARVVFEELDRTRTRRITSDEWNDAFERARLSGSCALSCNTISDLFAVADADKDGFVTLHEFQAFGADYPKLLDSLYYRFRSLVHETARKANLQRAKDEEAADRDRYEKVAEEVLGQESTVIEQQRRAELSERDVQEAEAREQDSKASRDEAHRASEMAKQHLREQMAQTDAAKEKVRRHEARVQAAKRATEVAETKVSQRHSEAQRAARELEKLKQLVQHKQDECDRLETLRTKAQEDAESQRESIDREQAEKAEAEKQVEEEAVAVTERERVLRSRQQEEGSAVQAHRDAQKAVAAAAQKMQKEHQETHDQKKVLEGMNQAKDRAECALENCRRLVAELDSRDRELDDKRRGEEERENAIVESEIRLREQRMSMEKREQDLAQQASDFALETGRAGARISPRRDYSLTTRA